MLDGLVIAIASGKGGTGKTTIATNLAQVVCGLSQKIQYLDCDVEEPNGQNQSDALIWRGPMKHNVIKQLAIVDVKKCIAFCRQLNLPVLGGIENTSGFVCPHCNNQIDIFKGDGGKQMAKDFGIPFLGSIPMDSGLAWACDSGKPFIDFDNQNPTAQAISSAFESLLEPDKQIQTGIPVCSTWQDKNPDNKEEQNKMRIAIPVTAGKLSSHFGHCEQFAIIDIDSSGKNIQSEELVAAPSHEPGLLPQWLSGLQVQLIIASGMGQRAQQLFAQNKIEAVVGAPDNEPQQLVLQYLAGQLQYGQNICDH